MKVAFVFLIANSVIRLPVQMFLIFRPDGLRGSFGSAASRHVIDVAASVGPVIDAAARVRGGEGDPAMVEDALRQVLGDNATVVATRGLGFRIT